MPIVLGHLSNALDTLTKVHEVSEDGDAMNQLSEYQQIAIRAGVIKHFEMTYELCWKLIERWLKENMSPNDVRGISKQHLFRLAAENHLIHDFEIWIGYHNNRNHTTHVYDSEIADEVYDMIVEFIPDASALLNELERGEMK